MTTKVNEQLEQIVTIFSEVSGLEFTKSLSTNSYYNHKLDIRISDHYSKFAEKHGAKSYDFINPDLDYLVNSIFPEQYFSRLHENVKIKHVNEKVGDVIYIAHSEIKKTVTVLKVNENRIVEYYFDKIIIL